MREELKQLREALRRVKYEAASLADAQVIALEALTQRPAAQTEREVQEARSSLESIIKQYRIKADDAHWLRASLPAPQQATPVQDAPEEHRSFMQQFDDARANIAAISQAMESSTPKKATPEPPATRTQAESSDWRTCLTVNLLRQGAGLTKNQIRALIDHAVDGIEPDPALFAKATPEPVGEPFWWLFQHEETGLVQVVDSQQVEWGFEANNPRWQKIRPVYTRPAPGVPDVEDLRDRLVAISAAVAVCDDRAAQSMLGETLRLLAAAQAKGAKHG